MKRPWYYYLVFIATFPVDMFCFAITLIVNLFYGKRLFWNDGLICELRKKPRNFLGLNIGSCVFLEPYFDQETLVHELTHVEQFQAVSMTGLMSVAIIWFLYFLTFGFNVESMWMAGAWPLTSILYAVGCWFVAVLRGEDSYSGSTHEEAALAISRCGDNCCKRTKNLS